MAVKLYGTSPKSIPHTEEIEYKSFTFSAGEVQVRLPDISGYDNLIIESRFPTSQDLMEVLLVYSAINESLSFEGSVTLFLPYLPYSRQDRACYPGEAFSLHVLAKLIATQSRSKDKIVTWDAHSEVAEKIFKQQGLNFINVSTEDLLGRFVKKGVDIHPETVVIAPDEGAKLRASLAARAIHSRPQKVYFCKKVRDPNDGSITSLEITSLGKDELNLEGKDVIIADDICDGGRTFIELAKILRKEYPASITLYVTHGIFSRGFEVFYDNGKLLIDRILTPNLFPGREIPKGCPRGVNAPGMIKMTQYPTVITLN